MISLQTEFSSTLELSGIRQLVNEPTPTSLQTEFSSTLKLSGIRQLVNEPTHVGGHTLDVVITRDTDTIVTDAQDYQSTL